jgi:predicted porin
VLNRKAICVALLLAVIALPAFAQEETDEASSPDQGDGILRKFEPYARLLTHLAVVEDEAEIQDNGSWLGMKFETGDKIKFFAHVEFGLNLVGGVDPSRPGTRTDSGLLTLEPVDDAPALGTRLGYLGVDFGAGGRVAIGKDNSMHYGIASYTTDQWNAFGGQASLAYPGGGDGGASGTGRADQVVNYRVNVAEMVELGAQLQFSNSTNDEALDGYAASVQVTVMPGLKLGAAYTQTEIEDFLEGEVTGVDGDAEYGIFGVNYTSEKLDVGAVFSTQENGDVRTVLEQGVENPGQIPVVFDGDGVEIRVRYKVGDWGIMGGYVDYDPDTTDLILDPDFRTRYAILGADWRFAEGAWVYTEFRIDDSVGIAGEGSSSVGVIGLHYSASWKGKHRP